MQTIPRLTQMPSVRFGSWLLHVGLSASVSCSTLTVQAEESFTNGPGADYILQSPSLPNTPGIGR